MTEQQQARRAAVGRAGEELAVHYLEGLGMRIVGRNVRTRHGELDILAEDGETLVVVEVRTVTRAAFLGSPAAAVTLSKARQVLRATRYWLSRQGQRNIPVRLDALGVELTTGKIEHLPGAIRWDMETPCARYPRWRRSW